MTDVCDIVPLNVASTNGKHLHEAIEEEGNPTTTHPHRPPQSSQHQNQQKNAQQNDSICSSPEYPWLASDETLNPPTSASFSIPPPPIDDLRNKSNDLAPWDKDEMQSVSPSDTPSYALKCIQCRIVFDSQSELFQHNYSVHRHEIGYSAPQRSTSNGKKPIKLIVGRKIHHCHICNRSTFKTKQHYDYHMRCHSGAKPFKCKLCPKAYRAKHTLKNHMRKHTGERPYQCKVCKKCFSQLDLMKVHVKKAHSPIGKCKERKMNL